MLKKNSNHIMNIGLFIIFFIFFNLLVTTSLFIFDVSISNFNILMATGVTLLLAIYIMKKEKTSLKKITLIIAIIIIIIGLSIFISGKTYDLSWDGNSYHKTAIGQLKDGWNPVYEKIEDFNKSSDSSLELNNSYGIWNDHYAKGYWIYSANIYKITNNIECGKSLMLLAGASCFFLCLSYLIKKMNLFYSIIISLLIVFNPVYYVQVSTFYNDGLLYIFLIILILSLSFITSDQNDKMTSFKKYILYIMVLIILINIKFTGFAYAGIYSLGYYIYFISNSKLRKIHLKKLTNSAILSLFIGLFVIGLSTYPKNFKVAGNIFYPLFGEDKVDIMTVNQPKTFENLSGIKKFFIANFSKTDNISSLDNKTPELKIPFSIHRDEFSNLSGVDTRIGGYGLLFSGILILSLIIISFTLFKIYKMNKNLFWMYVIPLFSTFMIVFIFKDSWWARYFPQLYLIPLISIILLVMFYSKLKFKIFNIIMIILMLINLSFFYIKIFPMKREVYNNINVGFLELSKLHNDDKKIYIYTRHFDGVMYNIKDKINNFQVIYNIEEFNKNKYQTIQNIYSDMVEVYVENNGEFKRENSD